MEQKEVNMTQSILSTTSPTSPRTVRQTIPSPAKEESSHKKQRLIVADSPLKGLYQHELSQEELLSDEEPADFDP